MKPTPSIAFPVAAALSVALAGCAEDSDSKAPEPAAQTEAPSAGSIRDVSVDEANELVTGESPVTVLDVRTPEEFDAGHIEGAINVNFRSETFAEELAKLDKASAYVLHCKSGARSAGALEVMKEQGFSDVAHMNDGFDGWTAAGLAQQQ